MTMRCKTCHGTGRIKVDVDHYWPCTACAQTPVFWNATARALDRIMRTIVTLRSLEPKHPEGDPAKLEEMLRLNQPKAESPDAGQMVEHLALLDQMEAHGLPTELDQDARDLHRLIREHGSSYTGSEHGDMTLPLTRSLARLVLAIPVQPPKAAGIPTEIGLPAQKEGEPLPFFVGLLEAHARDLARRLEEAERGHLATIDQRDAAEDALGDAYALVMGSHPEWSSAFGYADALREIAERLGWALDERGRLEGELAMALDSLTPHGTPKAGVPTKPIDPFASDRVIADKFEAWGQDLTAKLKEEREEHARLQSRCFEGFPTGSSVFDALAEARAEVARLQGLIDTAQNKDHVFAAMCAAAAERDTLKDQLAEARTRLEAFNMDIMAEGARHERERIRAELAPLHLTIVGNFPGSPFKGFRAEDVTAVLGPRTNEATRG